MITIVDFRMPTFPPVFRVAGATVLDKIAVFSAELACRIRFVASSGIFPLEKSGGKTVNPIDRVRHLLQKRKARTVVAFSVSKAVSTEYGGLIHG